VPTTTITIYEVSNSYVTNGSNTSISGVFQLTITDGDLTLQSSEGSDSGSSQAGESGEGLCFDEVCEIVIVPCGGFQAQSD
jgi:hypothetical protein